MALGHIQVERHGVTVAFEHVPHEQIGQILDVVLRDLMALDKRYQLAPEPEPVQIGGYAPLDVPEDYEEVEDNGPVIGFHPTARP